MNKEIWKDIDGYEGRYKVSNEGRIKSLISDNKILKQYIGAHYYNISLSDKNGKREGHKVHRLVATCFNKKPKSDEELVVDHIDHNKLNNYSLNLRWVTQSENIQHYFDTQKKEIDKPIIQYDNNMKKIQEWKNMKEIIQHNKKYNKCTLYNCLSGNNKTGYGYIWKYKYDTKTDVLLEIDEVFKNVGIIDSCDYSNYEVSNYGKIKSIKYNKYMKYNTTSFYYTVMLYDKNICKDKGKRMQVHRLVAYLFVQGKTEIKNVVNHLDEDKHNNCAKNLEWATRRENTIYSLGKKIYQIDKITNQILNIFDSISYAIEYLGKNNSHNISNCCNGKRNTAYGYKWKFVTDCKNENIDINPIIQYTDDGTIMNEWNGIFEFIKKNNNKKIDSHEIYKCLIGDKNMAYEYKWEYKYEYTTKPKDIFEEDEVFKNIGMFEGNDFSMYEVSNYGKIRSLHTNQIMLLKFGGIYMRVKLKIRKIKKQLDISVYKLVAHIYVKGKTNKNRYIKHIDKNKLNNDYKNLEWCEEKPSHPLNKKVNQLSLKTGKIINTFQSMTKACKYLGKKHDGMCTGIAFCCKNKQKSSFGYGWEYANDDQEITKIPISLEQLENKKGEVWKDLINYEDEYQISNFGRVKSKKKKIINKLHIEKGYYCISLSKNNKNKRFRIHRLVSTHFIDNPKNKRMIYHIDENKLNNHIDNLKWYNRYELSKPVKKYESQNYNGLIGKNVLQYDMNGTFIKEWSCVVEIVKHNNTYRKSSIYACITGKQNSAYGYIWKYKNDKKIKKIENDEIFKNIGIIDDKDFSNYEISNYGNIKSLYTNKLMKYSINKGGYYYNNLIDKTTKKGKIMTIHKIVAELFVDGKTNEKKFINYIDKNKKNNHYKNLKWSYWKNNINSDGKKIVQLDLETGKKINTYGSIIEAAYAIYDSNKNMKSLRNDVKLKKSVKSIKSGISKCCMKQSKYSYGYNWEYEEK